MDLMKKFWGNASLGTKAFIILLFTIFIASIWYTPEKPINTSQSVRSEPRITPDPNYTIEPTVTVEATPLPYEELDFRIMVKDFDDNQLNASKKYKGNKYMFVGYVDNISESFGESYVQVNPVDDEYYWGTYAHLSGFSNEDELLSLINGEDAAFVCICDGMSLGSITMKECSVVQ